MSQIVEKKPHHARTHGMSRTRVYRIWHGMRQRCTNPKSPSFAYYGGRAFPGPVVICKRWQTLANFVADMGHPPSDAHSIGRMNWRLGYTPSNCRWETSKEQGRSRSNVNLVRTHTGEHVLADASLELGKKPGTVAMRRANGFSTQKALLAGAGVRNKMAKKYDSPALNSVTFKSMCEASNVNYQAAHKNLQRRDLSPDDAIEFTRGGWRDHTNIAAARRLGVTGACITQRIKAGWTREEATSLPRHARRPLVAA